LLISHIHNQLSAQSTQALLCLGAWSKAGYVENGDLSVAASFPDAKEGETWSDDDWEVV